VLVGSEVAAVVAVAAAVKAVQRQTLATHTLQLVERTKGRQIERTTLHVQT
jgi:hypothetical protein